MRRRDLLVGAGGIAGSSSLIVGSNAFSSADADRELQVDIVGDEEAYLALHHRYELDEGRRPATVICGEDVTLFDIQNRFSAPIQTLDVSVEDDERFEISVDSDSLGPGEKDPVRLETDFSNGCQEGPFDITVEIEASGDGFSVTAERDFEIEVEVRPQFECLEATVQQAGSGQRVRSVEFRYRLNVPSNVVFEVRGDGNSEGVAGSEEQDPCKSDAQTLCTVEVDSEQGNFKPPIDIAAWIEGRKSEGPSASWSLDDDKHISLVGGGCSDQG